MQIICNHCGNQLNFPDYQNLVTCNHCATHLQIEETETTYSASVIDAQTFDELLTPNTPNYLIQTETIAPFFEKLTLEEEYTESLEANRFRSLLSGKSLRPMLLRSIYRLAVAVVAFLIGYNFLPYNTFSNIGFWSAFMLIYSVFIGIVGFRELKKWWRLFRFEREYKIDNRIVTEEIDALLNNGNPPDALRRWYKRWLDLETELTNIKTEFCYQKFIFKIPTGAPSVSKGLRILVMTLLILPFVLGLYQFSEMLSIIIGIAYVILMLILGFSVMGDANIYQNAYEMYLEDKAKQLKWLREYFEKN